MLGQRRVFPHHVGHADLHRRGVGVAVAEQGHGVRRRQGQVQLDAAEQRPDFVLGLVVDSHIAILPNDDEQVV